MEHIIQIMESYQKDDELMNAFNFYLEEMKSWYGSNVDIIYYDEFDVEISEEDFNIVLDRLIFLRATRTIDYLKKKIFYFHIYENMIYEISIKPKGYCDSLDGEGCSYFKIVIAPSIEFRNNNSDSDC